jgi:hypothetical protein
MTTSAVALAGIATHDLRQEQHCLYIEQRFCRSLLVPSVFLCLRCQ